MKGVKAERLDKRLAALRVALLKHTGKTISLDDLAIASSYKKETLRAYLSKNMLAPRVVLESSGACRVGTCDGLTIDELRRSLSQRANRYTWEHLGVSELVSSLLDRSRTNAGLALELVNRPELANRIDAFVLLFHTAWEQLLKAERERVDTGSIFTGGTSQSGRPMTIGMPQLLERCFQSTKDPVRRNIEWLKELRDGAAHLLVPEIIGITTRYFQSSLLNYIGHFQKFTGVPPFRFEGTGLLTLGVAYTSPNIDALRAAHGPNAAEVKALIQRLESEAEQADDPRFAVSIRYELVLQKGAGDEAIRLVSSTDGTAVAAVHVPKDPKLLCPHTTTAIAAILKQRTGIDWTKDLVSKIATYLDVKSTDNEFHYAYKVNSQTFHSYSERFAEKVQERLKQTPDLLDKVREHALARQKKKRADKPSN